MGRRASRTSSATQRDRILEHQYGWQALELPDGRVVGLGSFLGDVELAGTAAASQGSLDTYLVLGPAQ